MLFRVAVQHGSKPPWGTLRGRDGGAEVLGTSPLDEARKQKCFVLVLDEACKAEVLCTSPHDEAREQKCFVLVLAVVQQNK